MEPLPPRNFKYDKLLTGRVEWTGILNSLAAVRSDHLKGCAMTFASNLERTAVFAFMASEVAFMARRDQNIYDGAVLKGEGKFPMLLDFIGRSAPDNVKEEATRIEAEYRSFSDEQKSALRSAFGVNYILVLLENHPQMRESMDAIFSSIIFQSWTAFEYFLQDAWVITVNNAPKPISGKVASSKLNKADDITPKVLHGLDYDLHSKFGQLLLDTKRVSFQSLGDIIFSYSLLLDVGDDRAVAKLFDHTGEGYVHALAAIRNLLAHKAGRVDDEFIGKAQRFPELRQYNRGEQLLLDGEIVKRARTGAALVALDLLKQLDDILSVPSTPPP